MNTQDILLLLVTVLATYRLAVLVTSEEPFQSLRDWLGVVTEPMDYVYETDSVDEDGNAIDAVVIVRAPIESAAQPTFVARGITCIYCTSFWIGLILSAVWYSVLVLTSTADFSATVLVKAVLVGLASSSGAILLSK